MTEQKHKRQPQQLNAEKIARYVWLGRKDINWYKDCEDTIVSLYGRENLLLIARLFAATSINTSLTSNIKLFRKALKEIQEGKPVGRYLPNIQKQLQQIRDGKGLTGRKINSFANAMSGDKNAVVVDIWLLRAFEMDKKYMRKTGPHKDRERSGGATNSQYTKIESWIRHEAAIMCIEARQLSAMIWGGIRKDRKADRRGAHYKELLVSTVTNLFGII
jgi:hypothetical protein